MINFAGPLAVGAVTAGAGTAVLAAAGAATCSVGTAAATGALTSAAASIKNKEPTVQSSVAGRFGGSATRSTGDATDSTGDATRSTGDATDNTGDATDATHGKHEEGVAHHRNRADARAPEHPVLLEPAGIEAREVQPKTRLEHPVAEIEAEFTRIPPKCDGLLRLCHGLPQLRQRAAEERKKAEVAIYVRDEVWRPTFEQDVEGMIMGPPDPGELVFDLLLGMAGTIFLTRRAQKATKEAEDFGWWVRKLETEGCCGPEPTQSSSSGSQHDYVPCAGALG